MLQHPPGCLPLRAALAALCLLRAAAGVRLVRRAAAPGLGRGNSYVAAVAQTVWPDGANCCPQALVPSPFAGGGAPVCVGAEPVSLPVCAGNPAEIARRLKMGNVARMEVHIKAARGESADIIVFSEGALGIANFNTSAGVPDNGGVASGGLAEPIPEPRDHPGRQIIPCLDSATAASAPALHALSCLARRYNITVVFDMGDRVDCDVDPYHSSVACSKCPPEGFFRFNTQVSRRAIDCHFTAPAPLYL